MFVKILYYLAAWLMRPLTVANELYYELQLPERGKNSCRSVSKTSLLFLKLGIFLPLGCVMALVAILIRFLTAKLRRAPFCLESFVKQNGSAFEQGLEESASKKENDLIEKTKPRVTVLSWNVCCISGGFPYAKGGVFPWQKRIKGIADILRKLDKDVICLQEMHDNDACWALIEELKPLYSYFYYNIGGLFLGVNSGLFVASKLEIRNPQFVPFKDKMLKLDSYFNGKGCFSFELYLKGQKIIRLFTTHLQHSENDMMPEQEEKEVREKQIRQIILEMEKEKKVRSVLVGDLNMTPEEYKASSCAKLFQNPLLENMEQSFSGADNENKGRFKSSTCFKAELMYRLWEDIDVQDENVLVDYGLVYLDSERQKQKKENKLEAVSENCHVEIALAEEVLKKDERGFLHPEAALSDHVPLTVFWD